MINVLFFLLLFLQDCKLNLYKFLVYFYFFIKTSGISMITLMSHLDANHKTVLLLEIKCKIFVSLGYI